jgi:hypothetical protein
MTRHASPETEQQNFLGQIIILTDKVLSADQMHQFGAEVQYFEDTGLLF